MNKNQKAWPAGRQGFAPILILGLVVVAAAVLFLIYKNFGVKNLNLSINSSPVPTSTPIDIKDWKTYTNKKLGFSIQYPKEWNECEDFLSPNLKSPDCFGQAEGVSMRKEKNEDTQTSKEYAEKKILPFYKDAPCENYIRLNSFKDAPSSLKDEDVTIVENLCGIFNEGKEMLIAKNGNIYTVHASFDHLDNNLINRMFSTFKFTK